MNLIGQKIELFVTDLEASVDFYGRVLGFSVGEMRQTMLGDSLLRHVPVWNNPTMIGLGLLESLAPTHHLRRAGLESERGIGVEICLYVEDSELDDLYARVARECSTKIETLVEQPWGARDFRVVDPDGYYVRISGPDRDYRPLAVS